ncbi:condensation domain-containing protein [Streptomyces sp. RB6PN25]|uniref:Condensation domain-containing protein n=1 Tax=Streptomyces humicola TaxID=2953240 RepID=A0ABT1Q0S8_9ACTN|nr:condensation domain-containing protein [Streptomyces humicola]MCQ4083496.1 condensation domain-containing protein [Streptomyces humicola]
MSSVIRSGPLTPAQQRMWLRSYWRGQGELFPSWSKLWEIPRGIAVDTATAAFSALIARHEILRTLFVVGPDGLPCQAVLDPAAFRPPVSVAPLATLEEYQRRSTSLSVGADSPRPLWAVRFFAEQGEVRFVSLVFDHIISDGAGLRNWQEQFLALCHGRAAPLPLRQPLDRVADTVRPLPAAAAGRARTDPSVRAPQVPAPRAAGDVPEPRYLFTSARYEGLLPLVDRICAASTATRPMVFMFAIAWLLSRYSGRREMLCSNYVAHRVEPDHGIECQMRPVDMLVEIDDDAGFDTALGTMCAATLRSYEEDLRHGHTPPESRSRAAAARGVGSVVPVFFNFQGPSRPAAPGDAATSGPALLTGCTDEWDRTGRPWCCVVYVYVQGTRVTVDFDVDALMLPERTVHAFVDVLPRLLEFMADTPRAPVREADVLLPDGFAAATRCRPVAGSWVHPGSVERVLRSAPGVRAVRVDTDDREVVARLAVAPGTSLFDVHEHVLAHLGHNLDVVAPHRYLPLLATDAGGDTTWWPADAPADGWRPAHASPVLVPSTAEERELSEAIRETHGHPVENMALSYVAAGGLALAAPAVVETLRRRGLVGLRSHHFSSPCTLRSVARALRPVPTGPVDGASYLW